jgi:hypothetical protein
MRTVFSSLAICGLILIVAATSLSAAKPSPTAAVSKSQREPLALNATGEGAMPSTNEQPNRAKAYLQAKSYARAQAVANLIQDAKGTSIHYSSTGKDFSMDERLSQEIEGMVEHVRTVSERKVQIGKDTVVEVTVEAPLPERWQDAPVATKAIAANNAAGLSWAVASAAPVAPQTVSFRKAKEEPYTSIIIDSLGLSVSRAMSPKILREDGSEVWGTVKVSYDFIADHGIVAYSRTMGEAYANNRAGNNPLVLRALKRGDSAYQCDVVLSSDDADYLLSENRRSGFLKDFRVIFLVDACK